MSYSISIKNEKYFFLCLSVKTSMVLKTFEVFRCFYIKNPTSILSNSVDAFRSFSDFLWNRAVLDHKFLEVVRDLSEAVRDLAEAVRDLVEAVRELVEAFRELVEAFRDLSEAVRDLVEVFRTLSVADFL